MKRLIHWRFLREFKGKTIGKWSSFLRSQNQRLKRKKSPRRQRSPSLKRKKKRFILFFVFGLWFNWHIWGGSFFVVVCAASDYQCGAQGSHALWGLCTRNQETHTENERCDTFSFSFFEEETINFMVHAILAFSSEKMKYESVGNQRSCPFVNCCNLLNLLKRERFYSLYHSFSSKYSIILKIKITLDFILFGPIKPDFALIF